MSFLEYIFENVVAQWIASIDTDFVIWQALIDEYLWSLMYLKNIKLISSPPKDASYVKENYENQQLIYFVIVLSRKETLNGKELKKKKYDKE